MNFKHPLFITGIIFIIIEFSCIILMPSVSGTEILNEENVAQSYIPYMIAMLSGSFLSALLLLVGGVLFILKSTIKKNLPAIIALVLSFVLPMVYYYIMFD